MRKLMWFTLGFGIAAFAGSYALERQWYFLAAGACALLLAGCLALMLRYPKVRIGAMLLAGCVLGFCHQAAFDAFYLSTARAADEARLTLTITATNYAYETDYGAAVEGRIELSGISYKVRAYLPEDTALSPGDVVHGSFLLRCTLPGGARQSSYYRADGLFLIAYPKGELTVYPAEKLPWYGYPAYIRLNVTALLDDLFPADTAAFARALLLGDTSGIDYETDTELKLSGIRHVVAVSGLHVTILFSMVYALSGKKRIITALIGLPVLFVFAAVAGFSPSIVRACIMHALMVLAMLFDREYDPPTALSFAVLTMLVVNPWTFANVGFQLSVGCMAGILLFSDRIKNWLLQKKRLGRFKGKRRKIAGWFASSVSMSLSAVMLTTPLCAYYFGTVSLVGALTNLLTLWVISYIFYGIMLACAAALLFWPLGSGIAWLISWAIRFVLGVAGILADLPLAAVYTQSVYIVMWLILCYVLLAAYLCMKRKRPLSLGCCATIGLCIALAASWLEPLTDDCRVTVLDVGQGQCILLQSEGKNFLVDCGGDSDTAAADNAAGLLLSQGVERLDGLIITHYDRDHAAGAGYLLTRVDADFLYLPDCLDEDGTAESLISYAGGQIIMVREDMTVTFGGAKITLIPSESGRTNNESGLCILFQTEKCDILITGDRSASGERELIEQMQLPELEVLIVGHHGSKYSTCRELLIKTSPEIAIISVGADNSYGHPTDEVLERLRFFGCVIYRTDLNGTVIYRG